MTEEITLLPVREFPDRGTKWLLETPDNVRCLFRIISQLKSEANLADCMDFSRLHELKTTFIPDNLRKQQSDLVFLVPFLEQIQGEKREVIIYILIEHYLLLLIFHRRDEKEQPELISMVNETVEHRKRREKVAKVGRTGAQALMEEGALRTRQEDLLKFMKGKFQSVPVSVEQKILRIRDVDKLSVLIDDVISANSIDEVKI